jgi:hypothetical protein
MAEDPITWSDLKTSLRTNWLDKDTDGFSDAQLEECIALAERDFDRRVFTPDREAALSLTVDAQSEALPSDFWGFKSGPYLDSSPDVVLTRTTPGDLRDAYPSGETGTISHFAVEGENILFGPTPSSSVTVKGTYYQTITKLDGSNSTNWLLTAHPDLYIAGALVYCYMLLRDSEAVAQWVAIREGSIEAVNKTGRTRSSNSGPLRATHSIGHFRHIQA